MRIRTHNMRQYQSHATQNSVLMLPKGDDSSNSTNDLKFVRALVLQRKILLVSCIFLLVLLLQSHWAGYSALSGSILSSPSSCKINLGEYKGPLYQSAESGTVGEPQCLVNSKWLRVSLHTVKFPGSETTYDDWLWIDYHDRINVLVEDETKPGEAQGNEPRFLVFEQTKYALEGRTSLAVVGGIIEDGEDPESAARREVEEEMNGLVCEEFHFLGRYRADVNRGVGWLNGFLATKCNRDSNSKKNQHFVNEVGVADTEKQKPKSITLTELREGVTQGRFIEVQWTATVAQALLKFYS